jgi:hypothetical protein
MDYDTLSRFVRKYGSVNVVAANGKLTVLRDGSPNPHGVVERAECFEFGGQRYCPVDFDKFVASRLEPKSE